MHSGRAIVKCNHCHNTFTEKYMYSHDRLVR